jgi:hypothetical protein
LCGKSGQPAVEAALEVDEVDEVDEDVEDADEDGAAAAEPEEAAPVELEEPTALLEEDRLSVR